MPEIRIGTSGWSYKHWKNVFYPKKLPQKKWLDFYSQNFDTVEVNSTFYRLPPESYFKNWSGQVPDNFIFTVKASRYITHIKRLSIEMEPLDRLLKRARFLGHKLGPVLFQLPPAMKFDYELLNNFILSLPKSMRFVFEFRHNSWFNDKIYELLAKHNVALCFASAPKFPFIEKITADFIFMRMHGSKVLYGSSYSNEELKDWAEKIFKWNNDGFDCYVYFNNDAFAYAVKNAAQLKQLLS